ncbi:MAG: hypothetical protein KTR17_11590 [Cellvibrionaceae bacterium]|nr:hypothetical protein [Cellvibrionaceae bacterium]
MHFTRLTVEDILASNSTERFLACGVVTQLGLAATLAGRCQQMLDKAAEARMVVNLAE